MLSRVHVRKCSVWMDVFAHFLGLINRIPIWPFTLAVCGEGGGSHFILTRISFRFCYVKLTSTVFGFFAFDVTSFCLNCQVVSNIQ